MFCDVLLCQIPYQISSYGSRNPVEELKTLSMPPDQLRHVDGWGFWRLSLLLRDVTSTTGRVAVSRLSVHVVDTSAEEWVSE